jgi:hypothetical protein
VLASAERFGIAQLVGMHHPDSTQPVRDLGRFSVARLDELLPL